MSQRKKCLLWGGYGWGNAGDELTLAAAIRDIKSRFGDDFAIISPVPGYTMALFPGEHVVPYHALIGSEPSVPKRSIASRALLKAVRLLGYPDAVLPPRSIYERIAASPSHAWIDHLRGAELLYLVGGGYLTDLFSFDQFFTPVEVADHFDVAIESAPLGIGPFTRPESLNRFGNALAKASVRVRDANSLTLCKQVGINAEICPDEGFRASEDLKFSDITRRNVIGINYFEQHGAKNRTKSRKWWHDLVVGLTRQGVEVEGFCFHNQISSDFSKTVELLVESGIAPCRVCPPDLDYRNACRRIASYQGIVTCRFHATVVANVLGVPSIATADGSYYTFKMEAAIAGAKSASVIDPGVNSVDEALSEILGWFSS